MPSQVGLSCVVRVVPCSPTPWVVLKRKNIYNNNKSSQVTGSTYPTHLSFSQPNEYHINHYPNC